MLAVLVEVNGRDGGHERGDLGDGGGAHVAGPVEDKRVVADQQAGGVLGLLNCLDRCSCVLNGFFSRFLRWPAD